MQLSANGRGYVDEGNVSISASISQLSEGDFSPASVKCQNCGLEYNADLNGAVNIVKLSLGYILRDGGALTHP
ncbi:MAG: zinc ribbon domain-containing protein [Candidatus Asgardarchaeia archaeon]